MSKVITYQIEEILNYRNVNVNILTEELSNIFDSINNSFLQSTQYIENRKKINYNQVNSSKWKKINSNINTKLLSLLNKITDETFSNVLEKVLNSNITNYTQLDKLSNDIISKILIDNDNNKLYCSIIKQIIDSGLWYFKHDDYEYINFRIFFINKLSKEFNDSMSNIDLLKEKYFSDEDEYFSIKNKFNALINTIINLHMLNILSDKIMDYVIDSLKNKYSEKTQDVIEYLVKINEIHNYEDVEIFLKEELKNPTLSSRYKFMIEDLHKKPVVDISKIDDTNEHKKPVVDISKIDITNEYKKFLTDANLDSLKKHLGGKINYLELLKYVCEKLLSINLNDMEKYLNLIKKIRERMNKVEYETYINENIEDFISELPVLKKYQNRLLE
jgi:hypothetical protein